MLATKPFPKLSQDLKSEYSNVLSWVFTNRSGNPETKCATGACHWY